jgi:rod shape-determining protein MreC
LNYIGADGDVKTGDTVVTSPSSGVFPPGIPVGEVISATRSERDLFYHIKVKPAVSFSKLDEVTVLR